VKYRMYNTICLLLVVISFIIFYTGCSEIVFISPIITVGPTSGTLLIEDGAETTFDRIPTLTVYSEGVAYMSFSGDGEVWTDWVEYSPTYEDFNIANNLNGTEFSSGLKYVYVRFKDENEKLSPSNNLAFDTINYEFKNLNSIEIFPSEITMTVGSSNIFEVKGYNIDSNEVPLDDSQIIWEKCCGVGSLSNTTGLSTTYTTASRVAGERDITASYGPLRAGVKIIVVNE